MTLLYMTAAHLSNLDRVYGISASIDTFNGYQNAETNVPELLRSE